MESRTEKLPKGRSYPLKPAMLSSGIEAAGLALPVRLTRSDKYDSAFEAIYYPDGSLPWGDGEHFRVTCRAVSSDHAAALRAVLECEVIPRFVEWARNIEGLDPRSPVRREKQSFSYPYPKPED